MIMMVTEAGTLSSKRGSFVGVPLEGFSFARTPLFGIESSTLGTERQMDGWTNTSTDRRMNSYRRCDGSDSHDACQIHPYVSVCANTYDVDRANGCLLVRH